MLRWTRPSAVATRASTFTGNPASRAARAVTGPIQATGSRRAILPVRIGHRAIDRDDIDDGTQCSESGRKPVTRSLGRRIQHTCSLDVGSRRLHIHYCNRSETCVNNGWSQASRLRRVCRRSADHRQTSRTQCVREQRNALAGTRDGDAHVLEQPCAITLHGRTVMMRAHVARARVRVEVITVSLQDCRSRRRRRTVWRRLPECTLHECTCT